LGQKIILPPLQQWVGSYQISDIHHHHDVKSGCDFITASFEAVLEAAGSIGRSLEKPCFSGGGAFGPKDCEERICL
jgi:hypothetical protein